MNLYQKYRPQSLDDIRGHKKVIDELKKRSIENSFPQAMFFTGNTGSGKSTLQQILAKNILCKIKDGNGNACNSCDICNSVISEKPSLFFYTYNASNIGIDEMRNIEEIANSSNFGIKQKKVIIIDELQELSSNQKAMKNILKVLEKPLKDVYFILGSMDDSKINNAIKNRTVLYRLKDLSYEDILDYLVYICDQEKMEIDTQEKANVLTAISDSSNGSMRTAISYLERVIYSNIWSEKELLDELGLVTESKLIDTLNYIIIGNSKYLDLSIDKNLVERLIDYFVTYYKFLCGVELPFYQKNKIKGLNTTTVERLSEVLDTLFELYKYPYMSNNGIEYNILKSTIKNKNNVSSVDKKDEDIKRPRRVVE